MDSDDLEAVWSGIRVALAVIVEATEKQIDLYSKGGPRKERGWKGERVEGREREGEREGGREEGNV